ncbi:hypothetical protein NLI96_g12613 [Meripilus lineatus]|uniref:Uncharacterized protein n=1 Tax=Meripilus lineatus TaxID=2056292 RepID=A0AAD5URZ2_9APHY|nr:hypothetical protein NLI96_g12613 [Physisporinus lineatus]
MSIPIPPPPTTGTCASTSGISGPVSPSGSESRSTDTAVKSTHTVSRTASYSLSLFPRTEPKGRKPEVLAPAPVTLPIPVPAPAPVQLEPIPLRESSPQSTLVDLPSATIPFPSSCPPLETIHERPEGSEDAPRPQLVRRRSSLKNGNGHCGNGNGRASRLSIVSQTKSVTWAMDRDWVEQMAKYENATREAEVICQELDDARAEYRVCVAEMREICRNIAIASEKIRLETQVLHREETAIRDQELKLIHTSELVESKESLYREKVLAVMEETKRVVQLCDKKRDHRDD